MLAVQAWGHEFYPQSLCNMPGLTICVYKPCCEKVEIENSAFMIVQFPIWKGNPVLPWSDSLSKLCPTIPDQEKNYWRISEHRLQVIKPQGIISGAPIPSIPVFGEDLYCSKCQSSLHPQVGATPVSLKSALPLLDHTAANQIILGSLMSPTLPRSSVRRWIISLVNNSNFLICQVGKVEIKGQQ